MLDSLDSTLTLAAAEGRTGRHRHGGGEGEATGGSRSSGRRRGLFRALLCSERCQVLLPTTKDYMALCGGCLFPARDPSASGAESVPGTTSATTMRAGGGGRGGARKSEISLIRGFTEI